VHPFVAVALWRSECGEKPEVCRKDIIVKRIFLLGSCGGTSRPLQYCDRQRSDVFLALDSSRGFGDVPEVCEGGR
jgi:hypothetical protein